MEQPAVGNVEVANPGSAPLAVSSDQSLKFDRSGVTVGEYVNQSSAAYAVSSGSIGFPGHSAPPDFYSTLTPQTHLYSQQSLPSSSAVSPNGSFFFAQPPSAAYMDSPSVQLQLSPGNAGQQPQTNSASDQGKAKSEKPRKRNNPYPPIYGRHIGPDGKPRKRVHPNKSQLDFLERSFAECKKPSAKARAEISKAVGINGRSVQIWFQNRRAREKKATAQGQETGSTQIGSQNSSPLLSPSGTQSLTPSPTRTSERRLSSVSSLSAVSVSMGYSGFTNGVTMVSPVSVTSTLANNQNSATLQSMSSRRPSLANIPDPFPINATSILIGTWCRLSAVPGDLLCHLHFSESVLRWTIVESGFSFRLDVPLSNITQFSLDPVPLDATSATIAVHLSAPPFYSKQTRLADPQGVNDAWVFAPCEDFTEASQASCTSVHIMQGPMGAMQQAYWALASLLPNAAAGAAVLSTASTGLYTTAAVNPVASTVSSVPGTPSDQSQQPQYQQPPGHPSLLPPLLTDPALLMHQLPGANTPATPMIMSAPATLNARRMSLIASSLGGSGVVYGQPASAHVGMVHPFSLLNGVSM
ncbi:hypothetical protein DFJ73DRAFT_756804 [Zopfochytrium polystomum]|nr:hypothetical protein DFJ73DRAFT_756804 [Zopfochytrium polystomum]